jgi:hypothetical protein
MANTVAVVFRIGEPSNVGLPPGKERLFRSILPSHHFSEVHTAAETANTPKRIHLTLAAPQEHLSAPHVLPVTSKHQACSLCFGVTRTPPSRKGSGLNAGSCKPQSQLGLDLGR